MRILNQGVAVDIASPVFFTCFGLVNYLERSLGLIF